MKTTLLFLFLNILLLDVPLSAQQITAFPEAEGYGKYSAGGRKGKVYEVINLNDSGTGSFRDAVTKTGARIIVFRVSGTITLNSRLNISNDSIYIAGQTAPGDGICIKKYPVVINANHVIIRYLRFRLGDENPAGQDDAVDISSGKHDIIIDHCSISWSIDECFSFYGQTNSTVQWNIVSESLYLNHHVKGAHGYGGIWGGINSSIHHNLIAHHSSRTPRFSGGETAACENVDFRNNVIFNWGFNSAYGGEAGKINIVGNYYKSGPATKSSVKNRIVQITDLNSKWYIDSNYVHNYPAITANNWVGGVHGNITDSTRRFSPHPYISIKEHSSSSLLNTVLDYAGCSLPKRDAVDLRIVNEVKNGNATFFSKSYAKLQNLDTNLVTGIIDTQTVVGGYPVLNSTAPPADTDHDGMPDSWETAHGLNPNDPEDRNNIAAGGYTYVETYLNELGAFATDIKEIENQIPQKFKLFSNYPNPFNPSTTISYNLTEPGIISLSVYDVLGRVVKEIINEYKTAGIYSAEWNSKDSNGRNVTSGVYFARLQCGSNSEVIKMLLIK